MPLYLRTSLSRVPALKQNTAGLRTEEGLSLLTHADTFVHSMESPLPDPHNSRKVTTTELWLHLKKSAKCIYGKEPSCIACMFLFLCFGKHRVWVNEKGKRFMTWEWNVLCIGNVSLQQGFGFGRHSEFNWCGFGSFLNATLWLRASRSVRVSYRAQLFNPRLYFPLIPAFFSLTEFLNKRSIILYALIFFHISVRASQINIYQTYSDTLQSWTANIDSIARCVLNFCLCFCWRECQQARLWCKWRQISFRFWMFLEKRPVVEELILYICNATSSHMLVKRMLCQWE